MTNRGTRRISLLLLAMGAISALGVAQAGPGDSGKLDKQIAIFERVVDHMLVESPNFLVRGQDNTVGTYIDGHGAVFTFRTSLVDSRWDDRHWLSWIFNDDEHDGDWEERDLAKQRKHYVRGKDEILETVRDFGEVLTSLDDEDWLEIRARLRGAAYFKENDLRKLTVRVRMGDVRAYLDGDLSESRFEDRVEMLES